MKEGRGTKPVLIYWESHMIVQNFLFIVKIESTLSSLNGHLVEGNGNDFPMWCGQKPVARSLGVHASILSICIVLLSVQRTSCVLS